MTLSNLVARLFVGGLPFKYTEGELLSLFVPYGRVTAVRIMHNRWGKSQGFGYVEFDNPASAVEAKSRLHNHHIDEDRTIIVDFAKPDPFLTPEGQERHLEAQKHKGTFKKARRNIDLSGNPENKPRDFKFFNQSFNRKKPGGKIRQSVFNARNFHSRVGAKFAKRNKKFNSRSPSLSREG